MSLLEITTDSSDLYFSQIVQLDGVEYVLDFIWLDRESAWYLNIGDQGGNQICTGIRLVVSWDLLRRFRTNPVAPQGMLICLDVSDKGLDITEPTELGDRVKMYYITPDDTETIALTGLP